MRVVPLVSPSLVDDVHPHVDGINLQTMYLHLERRLSHGPDLDSISFPAYWRFHTTVGRVADDLPAALRPGLKLRLPGIPFLNDDAADLRVGS